MRNKAEEQAIVWLHSVADGYGFDSINAGNALAMLEKRQKRIEALGAAFSKVKDQRNRAWRALEEAREGVAQMEQDRSEEDSQLFYCEHCRLFVPSEVIMTTESFSDAEFNLLSIKTPIRICLRCGEQIFDSALDSKTMSVAERLKEGRGENDDLSCTCNGNGTERYSFTGTGGDAEAHARASVKCFERASTADRKK